MKRRIFFVFFFVSLFLSSCEIDEYKVDPSPSPSPSPHPSKNVTLFGKNADSRFFFNPNAYRIPCVTTSANNEMLLATSDIRYESGDDLNTIEVAFCRSLDGGKTWGNYQKIFHRNSNSNIYNRVHDCALIVDRNPKSKFYGRIWAFAKNITTDLPEPDWISPGIMTFLSTYSDDNGLTWSAQKELFNLFPEEAFHTSTGITPGITLSNGVLVLSTYFTRMENGVKKQRSSFIFSNDGLNWNAGPITPLESGENSIIQQEDGTLIMNSRSAFVDTARRRVFSLQLTDNKFAGAFWVNRPELEVFRTVNCQESLVYNKGVYLMSQPTGYEDGTGRNKITIFKSLDLINWNKLTLITTLPSAGYSTIVFTEKIFGIIYEAPGSQIDFTSLDDILSDVYTDQ